MINKLLRASIRKLSDLSTELLRSGDSELMLEIQKMIVRLFEIQEQLTKKEEPRP
ncbi:hypothetical protein DSECCO2_401440 [anaerobic digester metagenome]